MLLPAHLELVLVVGSGGPCLTCTALRESEVVRCTADLCRVL